MLPLETIPPLLFFMGVLLAAVLGGLAASGHFPREHRAQTLRHGAGPAILFGSLGVVMVSAALAIGLIWGRVPWFAAVIGGGAIVLFAPLLLRPFPDSFVNGRAALLVCSAASAGLLVLLALWVLLRA